MGYSLKFLGQEVAENIWQQEKLRRTKKQRSQKKRQKGLIDQNESPGFLFLERAFAVPDQLAFIADDGVVNFARFARIIWSFVRNLHERGVVSGDVVAVESDDLVSVFASIFATSLLDAKWIPFQNAYLLPTTMRPKLILSSKDNPTKRANGAVYLDSPWFNDIPGELQIVTPKLHKNSWLLLSTSGTTGKPKLLGLSQSTMVRRAMALSGDFETRKTVYCGLAGTNAPPYISFGLTALLNGCTIVRSYDFSLWRQAGVNMVHGSVAQVSGLLGTVQFEEKFPQVVVGGSSLSDTLARHLLNNFEVVVEVYAATETNRSYKNVKSLDTKNEVVTVGERLDSEIEIVDLNGNHVEPGNSGEVRVRNKYLCEGYLDHPEAQAQSFRSGWFYPGDIGFWGPNENLCILGRNSDILNVEGTKINASETDAALMSTPGILEAVAFIGDSADGGNELVAFATFQTGVDIDEVGKLALQECSIRLGSTRTPKRLIQVDDLPRAQDGGSKRFLCATILRNLKTK